ncbi:MAG: hypothetical protein RBR49_11460 [Desulfovibrio desulfuricans]|nr:hypothetical protein [Desulfovibrio desulfuricans]
MPTITNDTAGPWDFSALDTEQVTDSPSGNSSVAVETNTSFTQPQWDFSVIDSTQPAPSETAAQNLNYSGRYSQQQIIEARQNADRLGASFDDTLQHSAVAAQQAGAITPQDLQGFSPEFVAALANNGKTVFAAREDLPLFNRIATGLFRLSYPHILSNALFDQGSPDARAATQAQGQAEAQMWQTRYSELERAGIRLREGADQVEDAMRGLIIGATEGWAAGIRKDIESNPRLAYVEDNSNTLDYIENIGKNVRSGLEVKRQTRPAMLPEAESAAQRYLENVVALAPQIGVQVASAFVSPHLGMAIMGAQIGGGTYLNLTDQGIDPDTALAASIGNALAQAPLERLGLEKAMAVFKTSGVWNTIKAIGGSAVIEGITEWMQTYPEAVAEIWAQTTQQGGDFEQGYKTFVNRLGEITLQGMYEGALALPYGGLFGGMGMLKNGRGQFPSQLSPELQQFFTQELAQAQAYAQRQALTDALNTAAQSIDSMTTMRQGPQAVAEMLDEVIPPALQQTWIGADDAVTLYQEAQEKGEAEAAAVLDTLGTNAEGLQQAAEQGAPLPVATAKLLTHMSGDTRARAMAALRATADGVSGAEAANYNPMERARDAMQRVLDGPHGGDDSDPPATGTAAALAEASSAQKIRADVEREVTRITQEIEAAGFPRHVAQTNAALHQQQALAMKAAYGVDPVAILQRRTVTRVLADHAQQPRQDALFHAMYAAKDADMTSFFSRVQAEGPQAKKSYFAFSVPGELEGVPFRIPSDTALHQAKRHSDITPQDNAVLPHIFQNLTAENTAQVNRQGVYGRQYIGTAEVNGAHYGVAFEVNKKGEVYVTTLFKDKPKRLEDWLNKEQKRASIVPEASSAERHQKPGVGYGKPSSAKTLRQMLAEVNSREMHQQEQSGPLGSVSLSPQSAAVSIFDGANLSTIPHESAHIFLDDLMRIAADDGSIALAELQRAVAVNLKGETTETARQVQALLAQMHKAIPQDRLTALHTLAADLRAQAQEGRAEAKRLDEEATTLKLQDQEQGIEDTGQITEWKQSRAKQYQAESRAAALRRAERSVRQSIKHLHGLDQARADIRTLRQWAGVAPEGDLAPGSEEYVKFHEAVARGFEQYLMEGKAPSKKLDGVFSRLRAWLLEIYKEARDALGLPISDDVRRVFDRMIATDQQMKQSRHLQNTLAAERGFAANHAESFDEWEELAEMLNQAEREVQATADRATLRQRNKRFKEYYADALESLNASPFWQMVDSVAARTRSADGRSTGGLTRESVVHFIGAERTAELSKARPGIINAQGGGIHADIAAMEHGFEDADTLLHDLYDALVMRRESKKSLARSLAEQQLQADDSLNDAELMALSAEKYAAYLDRVDETVLRIAARKGYRTVEEQDRFIRNSITPRTRIQAMAADHLRHTPLRDITPERYQAMLDNALRDRSKALVDGDVMGAVRAVENARMANELIWGSRAQLARRDRLLKLAAETAAAKPGTYPTVHREAIRKLLNQYDLAHMRGQSDAEYRHARLRDLVGQTMQDDVVEVLPSFANWLLDGTNPNTGNPLPGGRQSWRDLTPAQLYDVENLLAYLRKTGYNARTDAKNSEAAKVELLATQAGRNMLTLPEMPTAPADSLRGKAQESARGLYAAIDSLRWQLRKADAFSSVMGDGEIGPMEDALLNKILTGEQRARDRIEHINTIMAPHLVHLAQSVQQWEAQYGKNLMLKDAEGNIVQLPASMQKAYSRKTWTADMVIALALNTGNASNMARITSGYEDMDYEMLAPLLGDQVAARIMSSKFDINFRPQGNRPGLLSLRDWQAIQGIWDALGTQWADTQATHERMFGFKPQGVEHLPLTITDPTTGQAVTLPGGYYPVRYDPRVSDRVAQWGEQEDILSRNESMFAVPTAKRGHTQARAEKAVGHPLRFDTGIIMEHINDAVRFIELGEITRQADRVTQHPAFRAAYTAAFGKKDYDAIRPNLRGLVRQEPAPRSDWVVSTANMMRKYLVPWGLAWNLKVAALQFTAVYPAMGDLGSRYVLRGMAHMARHGMGALRQIWDVSPYMKSRLNNIDQDLQRNIANFNPSKRPASVSIGGKEISWEDMVNAGMLPIVAVDAAATAAVWMGAYSKKLAQLQDSAVKYGVNTDSEFHQQAVDFADSMVKQSNPDYDPSSRSGFLRAQNSYRLVNNFSSAITLFAARHKYMYTARSKGKASLGRLARFEMYDTILPAVSMFMFLALVRGYVGSDKDDKKDVAELFTASMVDFAGMRFPIFGQAAGDALMGLMGFNEGGQRVSGLRTALDMPFQLGQAVTNRSGRAMWQGVKNGDQAKALVYGAADIASFIARVPASKLARNAERGYDQWQRGQGTALSVAFPRPGK